MYADAPEELRVEVRLLNDPCLWCWEIRDPARNEVVANSWTAEWRAFDSPEEAYSDARSRIENVGV